MLRPHADRHRRRLVRRSRPASRRFPARSTATSRPCARASPRASCPRAARCVEVVTQIARYTDDAGLLRDVRRRCRARRRGSCRHPSPATSPTTPTRRASSYDALAQFLSAELAPAAEREGCRRARALRAAVAPVPRRDDRPRRDLRLGRRGARPHGRRAGVDRATRSRPAPSVEEAVAFLEEDASPQAPRHRRAAALDAGDERPRDRRARQDPLRHPRADPPARVHDRADEGRRDLLHRADRRLLASRPHVVVGARGRRGVRHVARADHRLPRGRSRVTTCRSRRPSTTARS